MTSPLRDEVIAWLGEEAGLRIDAGVSDVKTLQNWGIDGDDGWELIEAFGKQFGVDLSRFDGGKHFGPECDPITGFVYYVLWRGMIFGETPRFPDLIPIRLGDLVCAAETKAWTL